MKKRYALSVLATALALNLGLGTASAQEKHRFEPKDWSLLDGKTIVKANITSSLLGEYSVAVERVLTRGLSLQVSGSLYPSRALAFRRQIDKLIDDDDYSVKDVSIKSTSITPELRWYTGGGYGHGFYLMAYYRYQDLHIDGYSYGFDVKTSSPSSTSSNPSGGYQEGSVQPNIQMKSHSIGFGLGAQWLLGRNKNIVLDWNILGLHVGRGTLTAGGTYRFDDPSYRPTSEDLEKVRQSLEDQISGAADFLGRRDYKVELDARQSRLSLEYKRAPWAWLRGSISLGFRF